MIKEVAGQPLSEVVELKAADTDEQDRLRKAGWVQVVTADGQAVWAKDKLLFVRFG